MKYLAQTENFVSQFLFLQTLILGEFNRAWNRTQSPGLENFGTETRTQTEKLEPRTDPEPKNLRVKPLDESQTLKFKNKI